MDKASRGDGFANKAIFFDIAVGFVAIGGFLLAIATLFYRRRSRPSLREIADGRAAALAEVRQCFHQREGQ